MKNEIELSSFDALDDSIQNTFSEIVGNTKTKDITPNYHISSIAQPIIDFVKIPTNAGIDYLQARANFLKRMNNIGYSDISIPISEFIKNPNAGITGQASAMFLQKNLNNLGFSEIAEPIIYYVKAPHVGIDELQAQSTFKKRLLNL